MAKPVDVFQVYVSGAIASLFDKGYLLHPLDYDVREPSYYILRIRGAERQPMVGVGSVTYNARKSTITLSDCVTNLKTVLPFIPDDKNNYNEFLQCIFAFAQQLREEASYQNAFYGE